MNYARQHPEQIAAWISQNVLAHWDKAKSGFLLPIDARGEVLRTHEGKRAFHEAVGFLRRQSPLSPFTLSRGLTLAARDHMHDLGPRGRVGHYGSDKTYYPTRMNFYGEWTGKCGENIAYSRHLGMHIVASLIADDGVLDRGHRANLYNPEFNVVGVAA